MSDVFIGKSFPFEDMTEVSIAVCAQNLNAVSVCIHFPPDCTRDLIIE